MVNNQVIPETWLITLGDRIPMTPGVVKWIP